MTDQVTFGQVLKRFRQNNGISSRRLSQLVGKADAYVSQIERNLIKHPDAHTAYELLEAVGCHKEQIEKILTDLKIADEKIFIDQKVFKEKIDPFYKVYNGIISMENGKPHTYFYDMEVIRMYEEIHNIISTFIIKDHSKAKVVVKNIHSLVTKDKEHFEFYCAIHQNDYSKLPNQFKEQILHEVNEIYKVGVNK
ncbi:helix-turn-helix domain-containing protein [Neobacillus niacini]|uniref:helix-turn-helix domain-containing protein n=1 Tax=Neobacillus niacini TaxID=86668 RepID=UPI0039839C5A